MSRTLDELVDTNDPMWPLVQQWIASATHPVIVLPASPDAAQRTLIALQVTTRSPLGAMSWETGGIFIQHGWLRLLGAFSDRMNHSLLDWNGIGMESIDPPLPNSLIIGYDVLGGFFAVNGGAFGGAQRTVWYFAPDTLRWEDLGLSYADFVSWAITGDVTGFYAAQRWPEWEQQVAALSGDQGIGFYPFLFTSGPPLAKRSRRIVSMAELWRLHHDLAQRLNDLPPGTAVRFSVIDDTGTSDQ